MLSVEDDDGWRGPTIDPDVGVPHSELKAAVELQEQLDDVGYGFDMKKAKLNKEIEELKQKPGDVAPVTA